MSKSIKGNTRCSGCGVCAAVCPTDAIRFEQDKKGFLRPFVNENCVNCGLCVKKCHEFNPMNTNNPLAAYNCSSKDLDVLRESSSGGVFSELASYVIKDGGYVCGATLVNHSTGKVEHCIISSLDEIALLRRSKYVESDLTGVLDQCKNIIKQGKVLLFVGCPCQCSAIVNYLGKHDNLILVDFICHGTGSPEVLRWYLENQESSIGKIYELNFRDKLGGSGSFFTLKGEKGEVVIENHTANSVG